jgi:arginyl-tRNA synthetase
VTPQAWNWPVPTHQGTAVIDGFSPNLNKHMHAGHLKNLAVAAALSNIAGGGKAVAMLGASLGVKDGALQQYDAWCELAGYSPTVYFDTELPAPPQALADGVGEYGNCKMYNGVVVYKSNGAATYAAHELSFAATVAPTHYLTGAEQGPHFASLGLGHKHLPLGLVCGADGKKMRSTVKVPGEEANVLSAQELLDSVVAALDHTPEPLKLAWNILAWQFNSASVATATKFNLAQWAKPDCAGLYMTYTYAKVQSALAKATATADASGVTQVDADLLGYAGYYHYHHGKAQKQMQPCHVAQYGLALAKKLAGVYAQHSIKDAPAGLLYAVQAATATLGKCIADLGMHPLKSV